MRLTWHGYAYYPYERELATREIAALLGNGNMQTVSDGIELRGTVSAGPAERLTYFSGRINGSGFEPTIQAKLEQAARIGEKKQATRYSVHGLHEYKGKFNPQVVRALLNIFQVEPGQRVMDPFCGSGTTLVECAHLGAFAVGMDINPLATLIARAKLNALCTPVGKLEREFARLSRWALQPTLTNDDVRRDGRIEYLERWFNVGILEQIELVRSAIERVDSVSARLVFLTIASNLLRDYSQQDPNDLRTRRRKSPLPELPFTVAFLKAVPPFLKRVQAAQDVLGSNLPRGHVIQRDTTAIAMEEAGAPFDAAVSSPPYAMALPYIDTQRLSLVWLGLCLPDQLADLEARMIGSREMRGQAHRVLLRRLKDNADNLPSSEFDICLKLHRTLGENDGFRRKAVPLLLYRYFASMQASFRRLRTMMKPGAPYGLIVGHNHTTIGGVRHELNTPMHLARLAGAEGWNIDELIPLQTYRRYGYHASNAVSAESLVILRNA